MNASFFTAHRNSILALILLAVFMFGLVRFAVDQRLEVAVLQTHALLGEQTAILKQLAQTTDRNEAISPFTAVIDDCSLLERQRYNDLLGRLDESLSTTELETLQDVFDDCAHLHTDRKRLMAVQLDREAEIFDQLTEQLEVLGARDADRLEEAEAWHDLADAETTRAELFAELVSQQRSIIDGLQAGASSDDPAIQTILSSVQETQQELTETRQSITALHERLEVE